MLEMWVLQLYCTPAIRFFQLTGAHTDDEDALKAKCHLSPQRCGSPCTVSHTVKLGAALSSLAKAQGVFVSIIQF